mmetsp:Transcript_92030/g.213897  ORF Transcript_92030/g.213897 Transcript_92030/m.213897 type:complete len:143 (+) Transcript_92030:110-538(+)
MCGDSPKREVRSDEAMMDTSTSQSVEAQVRTFKSYGAWWQAQQPRDNANEVLRSGKPSSFWPFGKDVTVLVGTDSSSDVYKFIGSHEARHVIPRRPMLERPASSPVLRHAGSATALPSGTLLLGSSAETLHPQRLFSGATSY